MHRVCRGAVECLTGAIVDLHADLMQHPLNPIDPLGEVRPFDARQLDAVALDDVEHAVGLQIGAGHGLAGGVILALELPELDDVGAFLSPPRTCAPIAWACL